MLLLYGLTFDLIALPQIQCKMPRAQVHIHRTDIWHNLFISLHYICIIIHYIYTRGNRELAAKQRRKRRYEWGIYAGCSQRIPDGICPYDDQMRLRCRKMTKTGMDLSIWNWVVWRWCRLKGKDIVFRLVELGGGILLKWRSLIHFSKYNMVV